jgi:hypothetical protein
MIYRVQTIFKVASSSSDSDIDSYIIIEKLLDLNIVENQNPHNGDLFEDTRIFVCKVACSLLKILRIV